MLQTCSTLASRLMTSIHDTYFMHTCVCMLCFNYGLRNIFYWINDTICITNTYRVSDQCIDDTYRIIDTIHKTRKHEHCSVWKYRIIVASTCRRSVQFGCYITWPWMANCVSVMIKMLPLFNFTISCHGRLAWKTSWCACALGGSRFWLVESTLFGHHVSLRLHREFSLKFNLSN